MSGGDPARRAQPAAGTGAGCLFCRIVAGEIPATVVEATDTTVAFRDVSPAAPAHVLVVPRRHLPDVAALAGEPELLADVVGAAVRVATAEGLAGPGWRMVSNTGADGGQTVFHVHLHVLGGRALGALG